MSNIDSEEWWFIYSVIPSLSILTLRILKYSYISLSWFIYKQNIYFRLNLQLQILSTNSTMSNSAAKVSALLCICYHNISIEYNSCRMIFRLEKYSLKQELHSTNLQKWLCYCIPWPNQQLCKTSLFKTLLQNPKFITTVSEGELGGTHSTDISTSLCRVQ